MMTTAMHCTYRMDSKTKKEIELYEEVIILDFIHNYCGVLMVVFLKQDGIMNDDIPSNFRFDYNTIKKGLGVVVA